VKASIDPSQAVQYVNADKIDLFLETQDKIINCASIEVNNQKEK
jgi:hypothetical protein